MKTLYLKCICLLFSLIFYSSITFAGPLDNWHLRSSGISDRLQGIVYGKGLFVAVSDYGKIITSPDGVKWTIRRLGDVNDSLSSVAFGNNTFIAVGSRGIVLTSHDGIVWSKKMLSNRGGIFSIAYGNGIFVAVCNFGSNERIITSTNNGLSWMTTHYYAPVLNFDKPYILNSVTYGIMDYSSSKFVAVGGVSEPSYNSGVILSSKDGITWLRNNTYNYGLQGLDRTCNILGVTCGNNKYVATMTPFCDIMTSENAREWTCQKIITPHPFLYSISYAKNNFVAVGQKYQDGSWLPLIYVSPDGISWTEKSTGSTSGLRAVIFGLESFVAVGLDGTILQSDSFSNKLIITKLGAGLGTITSDLSPIDCGTVCTASYAWGDEITLTANPNTYSNFVGWSGDCVGTSATCTLTATKERLVNASFSLKGDVNGNGTVNLIDAIHILRILSGLTPSEPLSFIKDADVNGDNRLGMEEMIFILQKVAGMR